MRYSADLVVTDAFGCLPQFVVDRVRAYQCDPFRTDPRVLNPIMASPKSATDIDLRSNDYLALGRDTEIIAAQIAELRSSGNDQMMSAFFLDREGAQFELECRFADLLRCGSTVLLQSGYQANAGLLQTIADPATPVYLDQKAHASLFQGAIGAQAQLKTFRHNDTDHLRRQLSAYGPGVVAIDSVYSTDGSVAPIADILSAVEAAGSALLVDESHSLGTHGPEGAGLVVALGLEGRVHFRTASLAKAFCSRSGLVGCSTRFAHYLRLSSFPTVFSSSVMPQELAGIRKTLEIVRRDQWRRIRLQANAAWLRERLDSLGYNVSASESQIIALEAGSEERMAQAALALQRFGVFGAPFFSPATAKNRACVRLSVHAGLTQTELQRIGDAAGAVRQELSVQDWASTKRRKVRSSPGCTGARQRTWTPDGAPGTAVSPEANCRALMGVGCVAAAARP